MSAASPSNAISRRSIWKRFGAPTDQVGSVNDPRTHDEYGVSWNEKWVYRNGQQIERVVLWDRYDLLGVFRIEPDGTAVAELLPAA